MKGTLHKTEKGWVVRYPAYVPPHEYELPLHPYQDQNYEFGRDMDGEKVDFDVEEFWETGIITPFNVAKIKTLNKMTKFNEQTGEVTVELKSYPTTAADNLNWLVVKAEKCSDRYMEAEDFILQIAKMKWYQRLFCYKKIMLFLNSRSKYNF
jgi:hypothetical protein